MRTWIITGCLLLLAASQARAGCDGSPVDQLDFWLGTWHDPATPAAERYVVRRTAAGCAFEEVLIGADGHVRGVGLSGWEMQRNQWRQLWVDSDQVVRLYAGGSGPDGTFVLTSEAEQNGGGWRYTYRDIRPDSLNAEYARRGGEGMPWTLVWSGHFDRLKAPD